MNGLAVIVIVIVLVLQLCCYYYIVQYIQVVTVVFFGLNNTTYCLVSGFYLFRKYYAIIAGFRTEYSFFILEQFVSILLEVSPTKNKPIVEAITTFFTLLPDCARIYEEFHI